MAMGITAKTDKELLLAITNLENDHKFATICKWLKETKGKCEHNFLWGKEGKDSDLWKGRTQMIAEILNEFDSALENLKKINATAR